MSPVFYFALLVGVVFLATRDVNCITNKDFVELAIKYGAVHSEDYVYDVTQKDDDVIFLPGDQDDELDVNVLIEKFGITISEDGSNVYVKSLGASCNCANNACSCCASQTFNLWWKRFTFSGCIRLAYLPAATGFRLTIELNGREIYRHEISLNHPPALCFPIPGIPIAKVCIQLYNINLGRKSLCAKIVGRVNLWLKTFSVDVHLGCFRIPFLAKSHFAQLAEIANSQKLTFAPKGNRPSQNDDYAELTYLSELLRIPRGMDKDY
ncbi:uncharacterized protein LOC127848838 isoform X2 [Dreissena polymorpha]|uniref:uncharacterized protein LOC127848838 isoform X2 n=1 Tax=Dreissena polymorpha TaxID=45954 RepID=UPI002263C260|nr:uncharacterized protein LOC127848838 isoform X2 [Dreissena polymorpha]